MLNHKTFDAPEFGAAVTVIERQQNRFKPKLRLFLRLLDVNVRRLLAFVRVEEEPFTVNAKHYGHRLSLSDIGLQGAQKKVDGVLKEHFDVFLGGQLGSDARFNRRIKRIDADDVPATIKKLTGAIHLLNRARKQSGHLNI